ncbi:transmembrane protein, putative (macronuclear) [Tetrahymena thermophila SB210]|uniref:Transmembrane protein, putative n=1 Tax=Tetrahymena thermophila (strain SB210) TaxID=312017 RepID=I7LXH6_TETTS|nr:transmembrane protein, putative [Tetrahymena thermophila SB210]EAS04661.2 transmembrane protein, putative [Tetrahymena thermophila SB210]|eukprot:XP_001024906.2 transmembrane protein, putative [Tetrahymena thermophila SB210]
MKFLEQECSPSFFSSSCIIFIVTAIICLVVFIFGIYCCVCIVKFNKKLQFEFFPILISLIMSVMLFFHAFKEKNIKIDLASQYLELTLFWAITYAIAEIYYTIKPYQEQQRKTIRNIFIANIINLSVFLTLGLSGIPQYKCENRYSFQWYFVSLEQLAIMITCIIYSKKLIKEIRIEEVDESSDNKVRKRLHLDNADQLYYQERVKQIKMVIFTLILCSLITLLLDLITQLIWDIDFYCIDHNLYISETPLGQIVSFVRFILQAIPSIMIPYIFYVLPIRNRSKENIDLQDPISQEKKEQKHFFVEDSEDEEEVEQKPIILNKDQNIVVIDDIPCNDPINCKHKHKIKKSKSWFQAADDLRRLKKKIICKNCDLNANNNCESECGSDTCIKKDKLDNLDFAHQKIKSGGFSKSFTDKYQLKESHVHDNCD